MDLLGETAQPYRVLARTYRPTRLSELIGQDALVRTLTNAMNSGRIAHAFLLCGIRGVGKTTTARIIARGLNCTGPDGKGGPTPEPCGVCSSCSGLGEDGSLDVIEMDAATRTGIDDIREIVEGVRYAPAASRYKVYIIDEVHMLSEKAFNGLLKTLEEPPPHAKFVFATTEARKVPVTVLSRCQRFDLRRVDNKLLAAHLATIAGRESIEIDEPAIALLAQAAEGSVRDSLSLLDQAVALSGGAIDAAMISQMLGLGDRTKILELFEVLMDGKAADALDLFRDQFARGADPAAVAQDLLAAAHWLSCLVAGRDSDSPFAATPELRQRGATLSVRLSLAVLARAWQMLLKGLEEIRHAPDSASAAEMILLRLACIGELPPPGELAKLLRRGVNDTKSTSPGPRDAAPPPENPPPATADRQEVEKDFRSLVDQLRTFDERMLAAFLYQSTHLISYNGDRLVMRLDPGVPPDVPNRLGDALMRLNGRRCVIVIGNEPGDATLHAQDQETKQRKIEELAEHPSIRSVLEAYPGAKIVDIRRREG